MKIVNKRILIGLVAAFLLCPSVAAYDGARKNPDDERYDFEDVTLVNAGDKKGYAGTDPVDDEDPHYGWDMGVFYVDGHTGVTKDTDGTIVILKNPGEEVTLGYELFQDIEKLNDDKDLELSEDSKAFDAYFDTEKYEDSMGLLIVKKEDYCQNETIEKTDESFLKKSSIGSNTILNCGEGDYEVALDYQIEVDGSLWYVIDTDTYEEYRVSFSFKVRNCDCTIPLKTLSGNALKHENYAETGFFFDYSESGYLQINVKFCTLKESDEALIEETQYNRLAKAEERFSDSGIYHVTIMNQYAGVSIERTIYVGNDEAIRMMGIDGKSLDEVYEILYSQEETTTIPETEEPNPTEEPTQTTSEPLQGKTEGSVQEKAEESKKTNSGLRVLKVIIIVIVSLVVLAIAFLAVVVLIAKHKRNAIISAEERAMAAKALLPEGEQPKQTTEDHVEAAETNQEDTTIEE